MPTYIDNSITDKPFRPKKYVSIHATEQWIGPNYFGQVAPQLTLATWFDPAAGIVYRPDQPFDDVLPTTVTLQPTVALNEPAVNAPDPNMTAPGAVTTSAVPNPPGNALGASVQVVNQGNI